LTTANIIVSLDLQTGTLNYADANKKHLLAEKPACSCFIPTTDAGESAYIVRQTFTLANDESIYGLGQHQKGKMNQRFQKLFLRQENMEICIPLIHSAKGYATFWHNYSPTYFYLYSVFISFYLLQ
jgi:alpha-D-xyloside xylohydrolase